MEKLIIEVRVNEFVTRDANPHIPFSPQEIADDAAACREAGASIVHFHARNADGTASHDASIYAECVQRIRACSDILVHPTLGFTTTSGDEQRIGPLMQIASESATCPDFAPMDMGSTNTDTYDRAQKRFLTKDKVYANAIGTLEFFSRKIAAAGIKPSLLCWSVPDLRTVDAFIDMGLLAQPAFVTFVVSDSYIGAHPATLKGLQAHLAFMPAGKRIHWSVLCKGTSIFPVAEAAIASGGHVSIGLGDYGYTELGQPTNAALVRKLVAMAAASGRMTASPAETRAILGMA